MKIILIIVASIAFIGFALFFVLQWQIGQHGQLAITAVDKNFFGTYTVYSRNIKSAYTTEEEEIKYCIDAQDIELAEKAKSLIGKDIEVILVYPEKRIGFFWFDKCHSIPVKEIIIK